jgi:predicted ATPase
MTRQPSGLVTFLFTDIEGSTRLLRALGAERYGVALQDHCDLLRAAFERHEGYEVNYEGDSFFIAFASAREAVAAAQDARRALTAHCLAGRGCPPCPHGHPHWPAAARAAQVRRSRHPSCSQDRRSRARRPSARLGGHGRCAGARSLRAPRSRRAPLQGPLRSRARVPAGRWRLRPAQRALPHESSDPATTFVGRERELSEVVELLAREEIRLLTLTGPGGTGKTRLAAQAAGEAAAGFPDGVWWVDLTSIRHPSLFLQGIAQTIGVKEAPGEDIAETVKVSIARKRALYVLDNAEHLLPTAAEILSPLVRDTEWARFLVTSREPLRISSEVVHPVPALTLNDGVDLFVARAAAAGTNLARSPVLEELCQRLDQLPLALELAAARTTLLAPEELLGRISQRLDLLKAGRDADPRQQTLRTTMTWSYDLLTKEEQTQFARLAVFTGGCTLEAAEQVCGIELDTLSSLLDKNLVRRRDDRFAMLETIRDFARERLAANDDAGAIFRSHAEWYAGLAERAARELYGPEQILWLRLLERDHDNLRAALAWALEVGQRELVLRLSAALHPFWYKHGHIEEGRRWLERGVELSGGQPPALRARVLQGASVFAGTQDDWKRAQEFAEEGLALYRGLGDRRGTAILLRDLGAAAVRRGDYAAAKRFYEESASIFRELDERRLLATVIANLGDLAFRQRDFADASERTQESLALQRELGATFGVAISLITLGFISVCQAREEDARVALEEGMLLAHDLGSTDNLAYAFEGLAAVSAARLDWDCATRLLGRAEAIFAATATELEVAEQAVHEQTLNALRTACSEAEVADGCRSSDERRGSYKPGAGTECGNASAMMLRLQAPRSRPIDIRAVVE